MTNSNISRLLHLYAQSPSVKSLMAALRPGFPARVHLSGLHGSQASFAIAAVASRAVAQTQHLLIGLDKEDAAYRQNDLSGILGEENVLFFPDSFKRPMGFSDINPNHVLQRSETIHRISNNPAGGLLVTYPEALFEKVVRPTVLAEHRIVIKKGEKLNVAFVMEVLTEYGFERQDFVYEPGQFSVRGGIIDLFSYGNELPYRVELFDDEVETIRIFDPLTQLSQRNVSEVSIIPNMNTRFRQEEKASLLRVLSPETVIWVSDFQMLLDRLQLCFERAETFASKLSALDAAELREIFRDRAFVYPGEVIEELVARPMVFLSESREFLQKNHPSLFVGAAMD